MDGLAFRVAGGPYQSVHCLLKIKERVKLVKKGGLLGLPISSLRVYILEMGSLDVVASSFSSFEMRSFAMLSPLKSRCLCSELLLFFDLEFFELHAFPIAAGVRWLLVEGVFFIELKLRRGKKKN